MTTEEKRKAIIMFCNSHDVCSNCRVLSDELIPPKERCWSKGADIERNYAALVKAGCIKEEPEFVKVNDNDMVEHPSHYTQNGIECIEAIKASMTSDGFIDYCKGNVLKYIWRWRDKGGVEDLEKAKVYLCWMIEEAYKEGET